MESFLANLPHQNLPNFEPLGHENVLSNPFSGASQFASQFYNHSSRYQDSTISTYLKDFIALNVSRHHESIATNKFTQRSNNVGSMTFPSKTSLESLDPKLFHEPSTFHTSNSLEKISRVSNVENRRHKKRGCKSNKNLLAKREIDKGSQGKIIKGQWNREEDRLLKLLVKRHGARNWTTVASFLRGRVGKQCRERWQNHLKPDIKKGEWTEDEEKRLIEIHMEIGSKWSQIAQKMAGRSENTIKNHWYTTKRSQSSSRKSRNGSKCNKLLQDYIRSLSSSTSEHHIYFEEDNLLSANKTSEAVENEQGGSNLGLKQDHEDVVSVSPYIPRSLDVVDDESRLEVDRQTTFRSSHPSEFDVEREKDFMEMLYEGYP